MRLGAAAIQAALSKTTMPSSAVGDVYMGNALQADEGQAPARQAALLAGLPTSVEAVTVNKVCASGLKAVALAAQNIQLGLAAAQVAGGMESMSQVPYYVARSADKKFGHAEMRDGLIKDGLWDVYNQFHMGNCAEHSAREFGIGRERQDAYAARSFKRAVQAWEEGRFGDEIVPVEAGGGGGRVVAEDEGYKNLNEQKMARLKPAFVRDGTGTITAANASTMNDGASAVVLVSAKLARKHGADSRVLSRIVAAADAAVDPIDFSVAPAKAIRLALDRAGLKAEDIAVWEVNEAFAAVVLITEMELGLDDAKVRMNESGGAIALGHALGSSGSRLLTTLVHRLAVGEYGLVALCNGGGAASAMLVQRVDRVD